MQLNRTYDAHMFYFFFESRSLQADDPVVLWMTGMESRYFVSRVAACDAHFNRTVCRRTRMLVGACRLLRYDEAAMNLDSLATF